MKREVPQTNVEETGCAFFTLKPEHFSQTTNTNSSNQVNVVFLVRIGRLRYQLSVVPLCLNCCSGGVQRGEPFSIKFFYQQPNITTEKTTKDIPNGELKVFVVAKTDKKSVPPSPDESLKSKARITDMLDRTNFSKKDLEDIEKYIMSKEKSAQRVLGTEE